MDKKKTKNKCPVTPADLSKNGYREQYGIIVICKDEKSQQKDYSKLTGLGFKCKVVVT